MQYRVTHYISGWRNGDCQTFAKGLFFLTKCSRGFRSVRLLIRRQSSTSIVIGCLTFFVAFVLFKVSRRSKQRYKYLLSFQDLPRASTFANVVACNWAIADVGQDPFDVDNHGKRSKWISLFAGRQIAFSMMEILK